MVVILFLLIGGFSSYFSNHLAIGIIPEQVQNAIQTNFREAHDLLSIHFFSWIIWSALIPAFVLSKVKINHTDLGTRLFEKMWGILGSATLICALLFIYYVDFASIFREHRHLKEFIAPQNLVTATYKYYDTLAPKKNLPLLSYAKDAYVKKPVNTTHQPKIMLLVIGEAARSESFSLNGYQRETNANLRQQNIINFSDVSACSTSATAVPCMFSGMQRATFDATLASQRENLLDIAKRANYKVTWINNNTGCRGVCNRVELYRIPEKIKQKWCKGADCYDEILLDALKQYLHDLPKNDKNNHLIVLHQAGSRGPAYYNRVPTAWQKFQPICDTNAIQGCTTQALMNSYDNSIVYTDHVLSSLIDVLKQGRYRAGLWYVSDHGESTGEHGFYLHSTPYSIAPTQQTQVPMLAWFSTQWQKQAPQQIACLQQQRHEKISQDYFFPTILSLLDIQTQVKNPAYNLLQHCKSIS